MNIKRFSSLFLSVLMFLTILSGCDSNQKLKTTPVKVDSDGNIVADGSGGENDVAVDVKVTPDDIKNMEKLSFEEIATAREGSADDIKEGIVYQYVSDSVIIDTGNLGVVNDTTDPEAKTDITEIIDEVNKSLKSGNSSSKVSDDILNYLLLEFANTPYTWEYDSSINPETGIANSIDIKGMDAATHLYFVDVTYKTTKTPKVVLPTSTIVKGSDSEEELSKKLYSDYLIYISDSVDEYGDYVYNSKGYPVFTNGHPNWDKYVAKERARADSMYDLIFGKRYNNAMYGWTESETSKTNQRQLYEDYDIDEDGNFRVVYRDSVTDEIVFDEFNLPSDFSIMSTDTDTSDTRKYDDGSFEARWGSLDEIYMSQNDTTILERLVTSEDSKDTIGVYTYPGIVESAVIDSATITFRFVLEYSYNIGINDFMSVRSVYLYDYSLSDEGQGMLNTYTTDSIRSKEVLEPFVERTLNSYRKAVTEENHKGLNSLFVTYDKYDRYFADLARYTYMNNSGFTFEIIGRKGNEIACKVVQKVQRRARGTNMTYPTYFETSLVKLMLCDDDVVRIVSTTLLSTDIVGEPMSIIRDVTGVSSQIEFEQGSFTKTNEVLVEDCIAKFVGETMRYQSGVLPEVVDIGVSDSTKSNIKDTLTSIVSEAGEADRIVVFIKNYPSKSNLYVSANLRVVYIKDKIPTREANTVISLIKRDSGWGVVNYTCDSLLSKTTVNGADGCFVTVTYGDTLEYDFPSRNSNEMTATDNEGNDSNIHNSDEQSWSEETAETTSSIVSDVNTVN